MHLTIFCQRHRVLPLCLFEDTVCCFLFWCYLFLFRNRTRLLKQAWKSLTSKIPLRFEKLLIEKFWGRHFAQHPWHLWQRYVSFFKIFSHMYRRCTGENQTDGTVALTIFDPRPKLVVVPGLRAVALIALILLVLPPGGSPEGNENAMQQNAWNRWNDEMIWNDMKRIALLQPRWILQSATVTEWAASLRWRLLHLLPWGNLLYWRHSCFFSQSVAIHPNRDMCQPSTNEWGKGSTRFS